MKGLFEALKQSVKEFMDDECMTSGASIAYYTIFSLPPLLVIVFLLAGRLGVSNEQIDRVVKGQLGLPMEQVAPQNPQAAGQEGEGNQGSSGQGGYLEGMAGQTPTMGIGNLGVLSQIIGIAILVFSATGVFAQLQFALNRAWQVEPDPEQGGIKNFLAKRLLSLGMIVVIVFLLFVSLVLTTLIDELIGLLQQGAPGAVMPAVGYALNSLATILLGTLLFAAMFKVLPDAKMSWKDVWIGAATTAVLFVVGKSLLAWYLQNSEIASGWGNAAASMVAVLVWVYYTSLIVLFGAELTQVWANRYGSGIKPTHGAVRKVEEKQHVREPEAEGRAESTGSRNPSGGLPSRSSSSGKLQVVQVPPLRQEGDSGQTSGSR